MFPYSLLLLLPLVGSIQFVCIGKDRARKDPSEHCPAEPNQSFILGKLDAYMWYHHSLTVSGMNRIIFSWRFSSVFFTARGGCLGSENIQVFGMPLIKLVLYLERLTTMLSSIWTSLTLFSMGVKRSDLRGRQIQRQWQGQRHDYWKWSGHTWGEGQRPCSARRGGGLRACCGSGEPLSPGQTWTIRRDEARKSKGDLQRYPDIWDNKIPSQVVSLLFCLMSCLFICLVAPSTNYLLSVGISYQPSPRLDVLCFETYTI